MSNLSPRKLKGRAAGEAKGLKLNTNFSKADGVRVSQEKQLGSQDSA